MVKKAFSVPGLCLVGGFWGMTKIFGDVDHGQDQVEITRPSTTEQHGGVVFNQGIELDDSVVLDRR